MVGMATVVRGHRCSSRLVTYRNRLYLFVKLAGSGTQSVYYNSMSYNSASKTYSWSGWLSVADPVPLMPLLSWSTMTSFTYSRPQVTEKSI